MTEVPVSAIAGHPPVIAGPQTARVTLGKCLNLVNPYLSNTETFSDQQLC